MIRSCKRSLKLSPQPFKTTARVFHVGVGDIAEHRHSSDVMQTEALIFLEIADSGGLRGVRCRQGPVAGVSAWVVSHATSSCVFSDLTFLQDRPTLLSSPVLI